MSMKKLSSDDVRAVLAQTGPALRALSAENQVLKEKVATFQKAARVERIVEEMESKSLDPEHTRAEKIAHLLEANNLDVVEEAIGMSAPQIKLAALSDHPGNPSDANSAFEVGLMGD